MRHPPVSYAQNFEDVMLWRALRHVSQGFFIDLGAQDPVVDSVSHLFHDAGWRGIHVEPHPQYAQALREQRPGDIVIQAAVGADRGVLSYFQIDGTGISTLDPEIADEHKKRGFAVARTETPVIALDDVLELAEGGVVHWLKIDVEGFERQVLEGWGNRSIVPWIVVVEATVPLTQVPTQDQWEPLILGKGFRFVYQDGLNRFYVAPQHPELAAAFSSPPNVFDQFTLSGESSAPYHHEILAKSERRLAAERLAHQQQRLALEAELSSARQQIDGAQKAQATLEQTWLQRLEQSRAELQDVIQRTASSERKLAEQVTDATRTNAAALIEVSARLGQALTANSDLQDRLDRARRDAEKQIGDVESRWRSIFDDQRQAQAEREQALVKLLAEAQAAASAARNERALMQGEFEASLDKVIANQRNLAHRLAELQGFARQEAQRMQQQRELTQAIFGDASSAVPTNTSSMATLIQSVSELITLDDEQFVLQAYRAVLGREPDPMGYDDFVAQVRRGVSKERIVAVMATSEEGVAAASRLHGLAELARQYRPRSAGLLSRFGRRLLSLAIEPVERQLRVMDNRLARLTADIQRKVESARSRQIGLEAVVSMSDSVASLAERALREVTALRLGLGHSEPPSQADRGG